MLVLKRILKKIVILVSSAFFACLSCLTYAAGYKVEFQSVSILAGSGEAAALEDAGTNWYNSAGNVFIPRQLVMSLIDVYAPSIFTGTTTAPSTVLPGFGFDFSASGSASSHPNTIFPGIHFVAPFKDRFAFGLSIVPAWGFKEDYGKTSIVRYDLVRVYTKTIDIAPSGTIKLNDRWSFGAGPDFHYFSVQSSDRVRTQPLTTTLDSIQRFTGNRWETGWHAGILYVLNQQTRIGANYRSQIVTHLKGFSDFLLGNGLFLESDEFTLGLVQPATTTLSGYHQLTNRLAVLGTVSYDQWGVVKAYDARNLIEPTGASVNVKLPQNFKNTFDYSLGSHYTLNEKWMLRGSMKYEPTPTNNKNRDINFPDESKLGLQIGSRFTANKMFAVDFIYGHVFFKEASINASNPLTLSTTKGHVRTHADFIGAQAVLTI